MINTDFDYSCFGYVVDIGTIVRIIYSSGTHEAGDSVAVYKEFCSERSKNEGRLRVWTLNQKLIYCLCSIEKEISNFTDVSILEVLMNP